MFFMSRTLLEYPRDAITDEMCELLAPYFAPEDYNVDAAKKVCLLEKCVIWRLFLHCLRLVHWVPHLMFLVHIDAVGVIEERKCSVSVFSFFLVERGSYCPCLCAGFWLSGWAVYVDTSYATVP